MTKNIYIYSRIMNIYQNIYIYICISFLVGICIGFEKSSTYCLGFGGLIMILPVLNNSDLNLFPSLFAS